MVQIILILLILINVCGALRKNNIYILLLSNILLLLIMGGNTFTTDYPAYKSYYELQNYNLEIEPGFVLFSELIYSLNFDYQGFLFIYFAVILLLLYFVVMGMKSNIHMFLIMYSLTQMFMDTNEIRQTMAYIIFAVSLSDYAKNCSNIRYFVFVFLASMIHRSIILFLPMLLFFKKTGNRDGILKIFLTAIVLLSIVVFVNGNQIPGLNAMLIMFGLYGKLSYFETNTQYGFLLMWAAYASNVLMVYIAKKKIRNFPNQYNDTCHRYIKNLWSVLLYSSFAMPLCMLNSEFIRYYKFTVIPVILIISIIVNNRGVNIIKQKSIRVMSSDMYVCLYILLYSLTYQHWRVVEEVMDNNIINDLLGG